MNSGHSRRASGRQWPSFRSPMRKALPMIFSSITPPQPPHLRQGPRLTLDSCILTPMLQFSLRNLLIAVAFVAVGTAALLNANAWWSSLLWGAALSLLVFTGLAASYRQEAKRAFWGGYVLAGSFYLLLLMYSIQNTSSSNASILCYTPLTHYNLVTTKLIVWAYAWLPASKGAQYLPAPSVPAGG